MRDQGSLAIAQGEYQQAVDTVQSCLTILDEIGSTWLRASILYNLGTALRLQGDFDGAERYYQESLAVSQERRLRADLASCLSSLGCLAYDRENYHQAEKRQQEALIVWKQIGNEPKIASVLRYLGHIAVASVEDRRSDARQDYRQALQLATRHGLAPVALDVFVGIAKLMAGTGEPERAAELLALAEHHPASTFETKEKARKFLAKLTADLPAEKTSTTKQRGRSLDWQETSAQTIKEL